MQRNVINIKIGDIKNAMKNITTETLLVFNEIVSAIEQVYRDMVYHRKRELIQEHNKVREKEVVGDDLCVVRIEVEMKSIEKKMKKDFEMIGELRSIMMRSIFPLTRVIPNPLRIGDRPYMPLLPDIFKMRQLLSPHFANVWKSISLYAGPSISQVCTAFYNLVAYDRALWLSLFRGTVLYTSLQKYGMEEEDVDDLSVQSLMTSVILDTCSWRERNHLYQFVDEYDMRAPYTKCHGGSSYSECRRSCFHKHMFMLPRVSTGDIANECSVNNYIKIRNRVVSVRQSLMEFLKRFLPHCVMAISNNLF
jgi:hypothetical protein